MPDDDIMDLTEVVKPGQKTEAAATPDFGSDLDALLQGLDNGATGKVAPQNGPDLASFGTKPSDGHVVNPNEDIELPALSDLDALLAELGVENTPKATAKPVSPEPDFDDLDAASYRSGEEAAAPQPAQPAPAGPAPAAPIQAQAAPAQAPVAPKPAPVPPVQAQAASAQTPIAPAAAAPAASPTGGIDLGELDAMLDKVLLAAPRRPARDSAAKTADDSAGDTPVNQAAQPAAPVSPAAPAAPIPSVAPAAPDEDDDILELELSAVEPGSLPQPPVAAPTPDAPAPAAPVIDEFEAAASAAAIQPTAPAQPADPFEAAQAAAPVPPAAPVQATAPVQPVVAQIAPEPDEALATHMDAQPDAPGVKADESASSDFEVELEALRTQVGELQTELASLRAGFESLQANLEKSAAQAAAKVIREELAALASTL
ncbi:MAG: hypothetical protein LBV80_01465 [Deltaproteobacteria bacterium]|jgi:hypothetical protein|nr:hypothetical protein [Deltaproteobacteria bacterium]